MIFKAKKEVGDGSEPSVLLNKAYLITEKVIAAHIQAALLPPTLSWCVCMCVYVQLFVTPWTIACQVPLSMEFSRQGYWSGLSFPSPGEIPHPGIEPRSPTLQADALLSELLGKPTLSW